ncbi:hypothetical protein Tco_1056356 [Tanacetum coccineum]|uniref:Uncharacterized protein n=1 Tax=Tanacetum coccineum TaxID=301880 RepID=A0ABQ5H2I2_9ASTR
MLSSLPSNQPPPAATQPPPATTTTTAAGRRKTFPVTFPAETKNTPRDPIYPIPTTTLPHAPSSPPLLSADAQPPPWVRGFRSRATKGASGLLFAARVAFVFLEPQTGCVWIDWGQPKGCRRHKGCMVGNITA